MTGMSNVVTFPDAAAKRRPERKKMRTFLFRSRESILQSDEADLVQDVCLSIDRAQTKLERIRARLKRLQEYSATEIQLFTAADAKLTAAIVAALLSTKER
jgi:Mg2+ and Co2+ transporter CorA